MQRRLFLTLFTVCFTSFLWPLRWSLAQIKRRLPAETDLSTLPYEDPADLDVSQLPITPIEQFGVSGTDDHSVDLQQWRLTIDGLVQTPRNFSYAELQNMPTVEKKVLLICPGTFAYVARWRGFSLGHLLQQIGVSPEATHVDILGPPGEDKVERFPLNELEQNRIFLATGVNGAPLPQKHGYPLRVVAEGHVGAEWVKFVYGVRVVYSDAPPPVKPAKDGTAFLP